MEYDPSATAAYLAGKVDEYVKQQARDTIMRNVRSDRFARYARIPDGTACDFCKMLGSRGFVYHSEESAGGKMNDYHPHCNCQIAVAFDPQMQYYYVGLTKVSRGYASSGRVVRPGRDGSTAMRQVDIDKLYDEYLKAGKDYTNKSRYAIYDGKRRLTARAAAEAKRALSEAKTLDELYAVGRQITDTYGKSAVGDGASMWHYLARFAQKREAELKEGQRGGGPVALSFNFLSRGDEIRERVAKIPKKPGYQDYAIHSDGYVFTPLQGKSGRTVTVEELAVWIRSDKEFDGGPVRLLSCWAGRYDDGAAQQLADLLGTEVLAPEGELYVDFDGWYTIARTKAEAEMIRDGLIEQQLGWRPFTPGTKL